MLIKRKNIFIKPDQKRVLLLPFKLNNKKRINRIVKYVFDLSGQEIESTVEKVIKEFGDRHRDFIKKCSARYDEIKKFIEMDKKVNDNSKILIGSYFLKEYSVESAALFNPSIVWHPDQSGLDAGKRRFILSLRAAGEGHISSIVFRTGIIDSDCNITLEEQNKYVTAPGKVSVNGADYTVIFDADTDISERIIFPLTPDESNGIEDARFAGFTSANENSYCAAYTAYDGNNITSKLIQTNDFTKFKVRTLIGSESKNKGMALFPKKINDKYAMLSRQDNENLYVMYSENIYSWNSKKLLHNPEFSWEMVQIGSCGSPIETEEGWLVIIHGVGPLRKYAISAILLDPEDPTKVIGKLKQPLLEPNDEEREGYVPNVVYSCGGIIHNSKLILPYAVSDYTTSFAVIDMKELLNELIKK
ncbi:beta-1,4-mannooligosaccharide phosphorylase [bacterium BMS3Abin03]|nr:beta-1,4-mannooligosaccharide phosphorylase [bacterium BMS3Abin03]